MTSCVLESDSRRNGQGNPVRQVLPTREANRICARVGAVAAAIVAIAAYRKKKRREYLLAKYGDETVADSITAGKIWQGMTEAQLIDS